MNGLKHSYVDDIAMAVANEAALEMLNSPVAKKKQDKHYLEGKDVREKYCLAWCQGTRIFKLDLYDLWTGKLGLYRAKPSGDKRLGRAKAIFYFDDEKRLFLEYLPEIIRWGDVKSLPAQEVHLSDIGSKLTVPEGHYLMRD